VRPSGADRGLRAVAHRAHTAAVVNQLGIRGLQRMRRRPSLIIPALIMPMFFLIAFSGSFDSLTALAGFPTSNIKSWMAPYAILQGASFAGVGAAGGTATDMDLGFFDRLLLAPCSRMSLLLGPLAYSAVRALIPTTAVLLLGFALGADLPGGVLAIVMLYVASVGVALVFGTLGLAVVYKLKNLRALALIQIVIFVTMFLSIGQVPLSLQSGWLHSVARVNPMTNILRMARQGFVGDVTWHETWPGLLAIGVLVLVLGSLALRNLRRLVP
jgi:ABC-2 type transport system permease protein